jgi:DNA repair photolyase
MAEDTGRDIQRKKFYEFIDNNEAGKKLKDLKKVGVWQWADRSYNIMKGKTTCPNDCVYCYVKYIRKKFNQVVKDNDIEDLGRRLFVLDEKKSKKGWSKSAEKKRIMFPSSHDIFPEMVDSYIDVVKKMIDAGHTVLCVTKPRYKCIKRICKELKDVEDIHSKFFFRFTISCNDEKILKLWEPHAPTFHERRKCLKHAYKKGFSTSVSMEPSLDEPDKTIKQVRKYVRDCIWVGPVNHLNNTPKPEDMSQDRYDVLKQKMWWLHSPSRMLARVKRFRDDPMIYWKNEGMELALKGIGKKTYTLNMDMDMNDTDYEKIDPTPKIMYEDFDDIMNSIYKHLSKTCWIFDFEAKLFYDSEKEMWVKDHPPLEHINIHIDMNMIEKTRKKFEKGKTFIKIKFDLHKLTYSYNYSIFQNKI